VSGGFLSLNASVPADLRESLRTHPDRRSWGRSKRSAERVCAPACEVIRRRAGCGLRSSPRTFAAPPRSPANAGAPLEGGPESGHPPRARGPSRPFAGDDGDRQGEPVVGGHASFR